LLLLTADEMIEWMRSLPKLAPNGHADRIERCPLLGEQRKTSARSEHFAFFWLCKNSKIETRRRNDIFQFDLQVESACALSD